MLTPDQLLFRNPLTEAQLDACLQAISLDWPVELQLRAFDVGCGNGEVLARLRELRLAQGAVDCQVLGIDPDATALERAAQRHAVLGVAQPEQDRWEARAWAPDAIADEPTWHAAFCLGSRHAFGEGEQAADTMLAQLKQRLAPNGRMLIADGYWRKDPEPDYLDASGMLASELVALELWHERFAAHGLRLLHEVTTSPEEFEAFERVFWAQGGKHWEAWSQAFLRWGKQTMGFAAWALAVD